MVDLEAEITKFNAGRDRERLAMKYRQMRASPFQFLRGTCHLFYARLSTGGLLQEGPPAWVCGDMHLQNFGSYKGDNGLIYFDINDFDEACLAPSLFELVRMLTSVLVAADELHLSRAEALSLCHVAVESYGAALRRGKARWIEPELADGMVRELFDSLHKRSRADLLNRRTDLNGKKRALRLDGKKALPVTKHERDAVMAFVSEFSSRQQNPDFYRPIDVARRIAGTGSLGVDRYVILVEGKGSPDGNYLLDLKEALPSSVVSHVNVSQPRWNSEGERVVAIQQRAQAVSQAFLQAVSFKNRSYVLRSLQPAEDRVDLSNWNGKLSRLEMVIDNMAQLSAWAQLRSSGRQGSATADELIAFGDRKDWQLPLTEIASRCAEQVAIDWRAYCIRFDQGAFNA
ncbi:MAG: hypothetical protein QOI13_3558 [Paraburkholderia sp.]|nr:hypothetical protein [Paraburkholderia sp.]